MQRTLHLVMTPYSDIGFYLYVGSALWWIELKCNCVFVVSLIAPVNTEQRKITESHSNEETIGTCPSYEWPSLSLYLHSVFVSVPHPFSINLSSLFLYLLPVWLFLYLTLISLSSTQLFLEIAARNWNRYQTSASLLLFFFTSSVHSYSYVHPYK